MLWITLHLNNFFHFFQEFISVLLICGLSTTLLDPGNCLSHKKSNCKNDILSNLVDFADRKSAQFNWNRNIMDVLWTFDRVIDIILFIHSPPYLTITWGRPPWQLFISCVLPGRGCGEGVGAGKGGSWTQRTILKAQIESYFIIDMFVVSLSTRYHGFNSFNS